MSQSEKDIKAYMVADVLRGEKREVEADAISAALDAAWADYRKMLGLFLRVEAFLTDNALRESKEDLLDDILYWTTGLPKAERKPSRTPLKIVPGNEEG